MNNISVFNIHIGSGFHIHKISAKYFQMKAPDEVLAIDLSELAVCSGLTIFLRFR